MAHQFRESDMVLLRAFATHAPGMEGLSGKARSDGWARIHRDCVDSGLTLSYRQLRTRYRTLIRFPQGRQRVFDLVRRFQEKHAVVDDADVQTLLLEDVPDAFGGQGQGQSQEEEAVKTVTREALNSIATTTQEALLAIKKAAAAAVAAVAAVREHDPQPMLPVPADNVDVADGDHVDTDLRL